MKFRFLRTYLLAAKWDLCILLCLEGQLFQNKAICSGFRYQVNSSYQVWLLQTIKQKMWCKFKLTPGLFSEDFPRVHSVFLSAAKGPQLLWQKLVPSDLMGTSWLVPSAFIGPKLAHPSFLGCPNTMLFTHCDRRMHRTSKF